MSNFIKRNLSPNEIIIYQAKLTKIEYFSFFVKSLFIGGIGYGIYYALLIFLPKLPVAAYGKYVLAVYISIIVIRLLYKYIERSSIEYVITNKRFAIKIGILSRDVDGLPLMKIETVSAKQDGIFGRIFKYGTVLVTGSGNKQFVLSRTSKPIYFLNRLMEILPDDSPVHTSKKESKNEE